MERFLRAPRGPRMAVHGSTGSSRVTVEKGLIAQDMTQFATDVLRSRKGGGEKGHPHVSLHVYAALAVADVPLILTL